MLHRERLQVRVLYILPVPHGVEWPEPDGDAQWFSTLPDSLHLRLWRGSTAHSVKVHTVHLGEGGRRAPTLVP